MNWIAALRRQTDAGLLVAARASQALAIESWIELWQPARGAVSCPSS